MRSQNRQSQSLSLRTKRRKAQRGQPVTDFLAQSAWFVGGPCAADSNDGLTEETSLATFGELASRIGTGTVKPAEGYDVTVTILSDLADDDPVSFEHILHLAPGVRFRIQGRPRVIKSGSLFAVVDKDRAANIPNQIQLSTTTDAVDHPIRFPASGSITNGGRTLGGGLVHVSSWMADFIAQDGFVFQGAPPSAGETYEILDYPSVATGRLSVSLDPTPVDDFNPDDFTGGLTIFGLTQLRLREPNAIFFTQGQWPRAVGFAETATYVTRCIIDRPYAMEGATIMADNIIRRVVTARAAFPILLAGLFHPLVEFDEYPGALRLEQSQLVADGDTTFIGLADFVNFIFRPADIQVVNSVVFSGPLSFWDSNHGIFPVNSGQITFESETPTYGETGHVQLWGTGNSAITAPGGNNTIEFKQFSPTLILPSIEFFAGPGGPVMFFTEQLGPIAWTFDPATATFVPPGGNLVTWQNFDVLIPAGFKIIDNAPFNTYSVAVCPNEGDRIIFNVFFFP